ncbi:MAG: phage tail tube protein [Sneathiella sp.]
MTIEAQGTTIEISSDGGSVWVEILGITSVEGPDGEASDIDVTTLKSTAKEYLTGLPDEGNLSLSGFHKSTDPGQDMARAAKVSRATHDFRVTYSDATTISFEGGVKSATRSAGVDGALEATFNIKINGAITEG